MVRREVVQLITPGTMMEGKQILDKENNFITSLTAFDDQTFGLIFVIYQQEKVKSHYLQKAGKMY